MVEALGARFWVPVEVIHPALGFVSRRIRELGGESRIRSGSGKLGNVVSDLGNTIIDVNFGSIADVPALSKALNEIPGVVGHGLFVGLQDEIIIARSPESSPTIETRHYQRPPGPSRR
jgi:ribose 5-phosphate isomerase A